ncbi:MAG: DUF3793 family protein [Firmicutes bacterium]|nr:DUF3793 family protein [Clostridiales bacterium]MBQ4340520.1 DUF3793 family protein [Bacillota bacterium]
MSDELLIQHCAPTLAGMKTGSMFSCECLSKEEINKYVRRLNSLLGSKGVRILPLKFSEGRALIYIYRPNRLKQDFSDESRVSLLEDYGYTPENPERCVVHLVNRIRTGTDFPHEVGLFLGYPPEDVKGFIDNKKCSKDCRNCKCVGNWKVYGDVEKAEKTFRKYKKCTDVYNTKWLDGKSVEKLTVAV